MISFSGPRDSSEYSICTSLTGATVAARRIVSDPAELELLDEWLDRIARTEGP